MKKIIAILLLIVVCFSFCACGNVKNALQGSWIAKWSVMDTELSRYYTFKGNTYTTGGTAMFGELDVVTGTYEIKDSTIHLIPDDGSEGGDLVYSYDNKTGKITLWWSDNIQFEKGNIKLNYQ